MGRTKGMIMMIRGPDLFMLAIICIAALAAYYALFPLQAPIVLARFTGIAGFMLLCFSLMLGPLATLFPKSFAAILEYRRAMGLSSFFIIFAHFTLILALYFNWDVSRALVGLPLLLAAPAFLLYLLLAITSNSWSMKNVPQWKNLQRLAYILFILAFAHFLLKANGLYKDVGGVFFVNVAEVAMAALGIATIILQVAGASVTLGRKSAPE
jgi:DMSO/TMAO reductase YedYZ heme-binding membrane subunit